MVREGHSGNVGEIRKLYNILSKNPERSRPAEITTYHYMGS
jgi:hypothetical protein